MSTYAEHQYSTWMETLHQWLDAVERSDLKEKRYKELHAEKAQHVLAMVDQYSAFDFMPGSNWEFILDNWMHAPRTTCRSMAIAAVAEIQHAIAAYWDGTAPAPRCEDSMNLALLLAH
jgi:hypothetical protein